MAYTPPHRRLVDGGRRPRGEAMPRRGRSSHLNPRISIRNASGVVRKLMIVPRQLPLKFVPFRGHSFPHLEGLALHTVDLADQDSVEDSSEEGLSCVVEMLVPDFLIVVDHVRSYIESFQTGVVHPKLVLRFGKLLFHSLPQFRVTLADNESFVAESLVQAIGGDIGVFGAPVMKTFDTSLAPEIFEDLKKMAMAADDAQIISFKYFIITVKDSTRSDHTIKCVAVANESSTGLVLKKIKSDPLRHLVNDVLCLRRKADLRIILYTEFYPDDFTDEEREALHALVDAAIISEGDIGGLRWPLGKDSVGDRFKVRGAFHLNKTVVRTAEMKWKFVVANRGEFEASTGRQSYELDLVLPSWKRYAASSDNGRTGGIDILREVIDLAEKINCQEK